ncbi:MAG: spermidine synthase [Archaeoglobaceae archaeon]|nr:spermidine synthase [Archaeoglobaceae archaeon]MCX8151896.1 spermidine synthase [Archaeoglobaceae archaeon]MDW8013285.1 spermidine synthase [Archaeoglobaceae archaeon]
MEWFVEKYDGSGIMIKVKKKIVEVQSLQKIEIYETENFGKMLVIDGKVQLTEFDEFIYHEMLVHVPMMIHRDPREVLIIGGGDGGTLREVLKHDVEKVVLVEIDEKVVELSKKYLKIDHGAFEDKRLEIVVEDGRDYVNYCKKFDLILVDSTDPVGVSDPLFGKDFFEVAKDKCDILCTQAQSPLIQRDLFLKIWKFSKVFGKRKVYLSTIPTYPFALWAFVLAGDVDNFYPERFEKIRKKVRHYNLDVHRSAFSLPGWLRDVLEQR